MPATSQFQVYTSGDSSGPGSITGQTGSLITILDACLVNGYSGHPAAGWTRVNGSGSAASSSYSIYAAYSNNGTPPIGANSASGCTMHVNDAGPIVANEAWITGWETMTTLSGSNGAGTGIGQFPLPAQLLTVGTVVCRKSSAASNAPKQWIMFADFATMYLYIASGDSGYNGFMFGDLFSLGGATDIYRCMIFGGTLNSFATAFGSDVANVAGNNSTPFTTPTGGLFMVRTYGQIPGSITAARWGDATLQVVGNAVNSWNGGLQAPNPPDGSLYLCPARVYESAFQRGRIRGLYCGGHPLGSFADGQTFYGGNDYAGKSFRVVKPGGFGVGYLIMETSATLETN